MTNGMRLGIFASHEGTTFQAVVDAFAAGVIAGRVCLLISNNSGSGAIQKAGATGISWRHLSSKTHADPVALDRAILAALREADVNAVLLAGFMKKLGPEVLRSYAGRILNTHPALLPKFGGPGMYGMRVHRAVLEAAECHSGASVHLVEADYDTGPVIAQRSVLVAPDDTPESLANRVQAAERTLLIEVLRDLAQGVRGWPSAMP